MRLTVTGIIICNSMTMSSCTISYAFINVTAPAVLLCFIPIAKICRSLFKITRIGGNSTYTC